MSSTNLVKLRNLDPEVLAFIKGHMSSGNDPMPYLKQGDLAPYFNKNTDLVDELLVADSLKEYITNAAADKVLKSNIYRKNAEAIAYDDLDPELKKKINYRNNTGGGTSVSQEIIDEIEEGKLARKRLTAELADLTNKVNTLQTDNQTTRENVITANSELLKKIDKNSNKIHNLENSPILSLTEEHLNKINNLINRMTTIDSVVDNVSELQDTIRQVISGINAPKKEGEPGSIIYLDKDLAFNSRYNLYLWTIVSSQEDRDKKLAEKKDSYIYDAENKHVYILEKDNEHPGEKLYKKDETPFQSKFNEVFIFDYINKTLYYVSQRNLINVGSSSKAKIKDIEIAENSEITIPISKVFDSNIRVLILDEEEGSRTKDKYINSEGILTVTYEENQIVLYNDIDKRIKARIIY